MMTPRDDQESPFLDVTIGAETVYPAVLANLLEAGEQGKALLAELIGLFLSDTPNRIADLRTALINQDATALSRAAHSLKGSAYTFGAHQMGCICEELEERARAKEIENVEPLVLKLEAEFTRLRQILEPQIPGGTEKSD